MQRFIVTLAALVALGLTLQAAETKAEAKKEATPAEKKLAGATVDKYLSKPKCDEQRFWVMPEFLMMWTKDGPVHDLFVLQTNFLAGGGLPVLDNPQARAIFSSEDQDYGMQMGGRLTFGLWADEARKWGFEISGFALEEKDASWSYQAPSNSPYFTGISLLNTQFLPPLEDSAVINFPNRSGGLVIRSESQLWGAEASGLHNFIRRDDLSLDLSFGVKHLNLREQFDLQTATVTPGFGIVETRDQWATTNEFFGAKLGAKFSMTCWERLLFHVEPAVSLGATRQMLEVRGFGTFRIGPATFGGAGGRFTGATNWGNQRETEFAVAPEIKIGLGCKITKNLAFNADYNFLYVSSVVRPGEQFNRRVNPDTVGPAPLPGATPRDPAPRFKTSDYWAQGLGLNFKVTW
jgi:hypothetical protein